MILILINETLQIFFYGTPAILMEQNMMIRSWEMSTTCGICRIQAVAMFHFNGNYDIHVGGIDLCYPHHEVILSNLIALSQKQKPVGCWMHVGILDIENAKMSKSSGNAIYIKELLKKYDVNTLKLYFYSHDYKRLNFQDLRIREI